MTAGRDHPDSIRRAHDLAVERGDPSYLDPLTGYVVFTATTLSAQGQCCGNGCRHCPFDGA